MKLRSSSIVTAIVTVIVTMAASIVAPASAEILTVCANSTQSSAAPERLPARRLADAIIPLGGRTDDGSEAMIALWHDDSGFDVLMNWGETDQHSLRADGAQIIGAAPSSELVHLMVAHDGALEHFLFNLDEDGSGELLRSTASNDSGASAFGSANAICVKPH
jgi:hypothetical protein